jgi:hypothetical protein
MGMKAMIIVLLGLFLVSASPARAQFLKNVLNSVKNTVQNRANDKATSTTNKALDKVDGTGKKPGTNGAGSNATNGGATGVSGSGASGAPGSSSGAGSTNSAPGTAGANGPAGTKGSAGGNGAAGGKGSAPDDADPESSKGYVRVDVSTSKTIVGGKVQVKGFSPMLGGLKTVTMTVSGPVPADPVTLTLKDSGSFSTLWIPTGPGHYRLILKSQDGKAQKSVFVDAYPFQEMEGITGPTREEGQKAVDRIKNDVAQARSGLSATDAGKLDAELQKLTAKWTQLTTTLDDLDKAGKGLDGLEKQYGSFPQGVSEGLNKMNDALGQEGKQLTDFNKALDGGGSTGGTGGGAGGDGGAAKTSHDAYDNTVCEYLTMISEACAAFSTFTNFMGDLAQITTNLAVDKATPMKAEDAMNAAGASADQTMIGKEVAKLFLQAHLDAESLVSLSGTAGFCGDMIQICSNYLLKTYCVILDGDLQETYTCTYRNSTKAVWWQYRYTTGATITLRYPKGKSSGGVVKMKGNIEGNATKFQIYTDMDEQDDFKTQSKGRVHAIPICVYAPPAAPFVSSQADRRTGFGAVARTILTPAVFNIPVDVDYDVDAKTMKIYTNEALVDFTPMVRYVYCYLVIAAGIPLITKVDLPINGVKLTLGKGISMNSSFAVTRDGANNTSVKGNGDSMVGKGTDCEHHIQFSFSATGN